MSLAKNPNILATILEGLWNNIVNNTIGNFTSNCIGPQGARQGANFLATNPSVASLDLGWNEIQDKGCIEMSQALMVNTNLKELFLSFCGNTELGSKALDKAIFDSSSVDSIMNSNHTCVVYNHGNNGGLHSFSPSCDAFFWFMEGGKSKQYAIQQKVLKALGATDNNALNIKYLEGVPVQFIPDLLELIQDKTKISDNRENGEDHNIKNIRSLKNVFEVLKSGIIFS